MELVNTRHESTRNFVNTYRYVHVLGQFTRSKDRRAAGYQGLSRSVRRETTTSRPNTEG